MVRTSFILTAVKTYWLFAQNMLMTYYAQFSIGQLNKS